MTKTLYHVAHAFNAQNHIELSVNPGEVVVTNAQPKDEWLLVTKFDDKGASGYVPVTFLNKMTKNQQDEFLQQQTKANENPSLKQQRDWTKEKDHDGTRLKQRHTDGIRLKQRHTDGMRSKHRSEDPVRAKKRREDPVNSKDEHLLRKKAGQEESQVSQNDRMNQQTSSYRNVSKYGRKSTLPSVANAPLALTSRESHFERTFSALMQQREDMFQSMIHKLTDTHTSLVEVGQEQIEMMTRMKQLKANIEIDLQELSA